MAYVEEHLLPGEEVRYRAHLHKVIYLGPVLIAFVGWLVAAAVLAWGGPWFALPLALLSLGPLVATHIGYKSSEFAITGNRVIIKVGWIRRHTLETMLGKVEAVGVEQGVLGRLLNFGTIIVTGTGGTKEAFANIARPLEFRRQVHARVAEADPVPERPPAAQGPREERDCPWCAERILARAKVCKHCGRDVDPVAA
jgi:membrane protein YdbS with pleckstrin-like domain